MSETTWAFDREEFWDLINEWGKRENNQEANDRLANEIVDFIQLSCEAHARAEVKAFAEEVRPQENDSYTASWNQCIRETQDGIDAALKRRGIV